MAIANRKCVFLIVFMCVATLFPSIIALLKLQPLEKGKPNLLVEKWKENEVYLVQFPRIQATPSHTMSLLVETWLAFKGIQPHRVSNRLLLGSPSQGTVPFVQFNGQYYDGSVQLMEKLKGVGKPIEYDPKAEKEIIDVVYNVFYMILMVDRIKRTADGKGGPDFTIADPGIQESMVPVLMNQRKEEKITITGAGANGLVKFTFVPTMKFWSAYFDANAKTLGGHQEKFLHTNVKMEGISKGDNPDHKWTEFNTAMKKTIKERLSAVFLTGPSSTEIKVTEFLKTKKLNGKPILEYMDKEEELFKIFMHELKKERKVKVKTETETYTIVEAIKNTEKYVLGSGHPTAADAALFAIFVMWFEMPKNLNFPKFHQFFKMKGQNAEEEEIAKDLNEYLLRIKKHLGFGTDCEAEWKKLSQRPFPLNYELSEGKVVNKKYKDDSAIDQKVIAAIGAATLVAHNNPSNPSVASSAPEDGNEL